MAVQYTWKFGRRVAPDRRIGAVEGKAGGVLSAGRKGKLERKERPGPGLVRVKDILHMYSRTPLERSGEGGRGRGFTTTKIVLPVCITAVEDKYYSHDYHTVLEVYTVPIEMLEGILFNQRSV